MIVEKVKEPLVWAELVAIGRIAKAQGRWGEVAVNPLTDFPERFVGLRRVYVEGDGGEPEAFIVEGARLHKDRPVLRFEGVSSIGEAERLAGKEIRLPAGELRPLPEGSFYHFEIIGLSVEDVDRGLLGIVDAVLSTGGTDVLVVKSPQGEEHLLPLCSEICRRIDPERGRIEVATPEGLIGLNAH